MRSFFHPEQLLHHPRSYYSRGQMRTPQEVPERAQRLVQASHALGFKVEQPVDAGLDPLLAVHGAPCTASNGSSPASAGCSTLKPNA